MRGGINAHQLLPEGDFPWLIKNSKAVFYASICEVNGGFSPVVKTFVCRHQSAAEQDLGYYSFDKLLLKECLMRGLPSRYKTISMLLLVLPGGADNLYTRKHASV